MGLGALSRNRSLSDIFDPGGALRNASAAWWSSAYALSIAAALFGALLTWFAWYEAFQQENRLAERELSARAGDHFLALQNGIDQYINDVSALRAAFQSSEHGISRREFQSLSDDLFLEKPAIFGTSWIPRVTRSERSTHELEAARDGLPGYGIKSIAADGNLYPAKDADEYFPILYSSRRDFGASVLGLDIHDGDIRQQTLEHALDTDRPAASESVILRRGDGDRNGFLVALPVYRRGLPHATVEDRRLNLLGFVQGVFQTSAMIEAIIAARTLPTGLDLYFFAADSGADAPPLYFHPSRERTGPAQPLSRAAITQGLHWSGELKVADRGWTFTVVPLPGGPGTAVHSGSWMILGGGLLISAMMAAYFWTVGRHTRRLQLSNQRLGEVNRALDAANERLQVQNARFDTALNNMSQGLVFFDGAQRLIVCNRRLIEMYGLPPDRMRPGITMGEMIDLRWEVGSVPNMSKEEYRQWRNSDAVSNGPSDTTVELKTGRIIRICRQPMPDGGWVATHEDITEQRGNELALAEARVSAERAQQDAEDAHARLVEAFEVVPEGIVLTDSDDRLVLWNSQYAETYSAPGDAIEAGMRLEDILRSGLARGQYVEATGKEEEWLAARLAAHARPSNRQEQLLSSGRCIVVEERRTANGGSIGVRIDVTEMKQREESFRLLFKGNPMPMWVVDSETLRFLAVNSAATAHYGYSRDEFLQMTAFDLRPSEDRERFKEYIQAGKTDQAREIWRHQKADGTYILASVYSAYLTYAGRAAHLCAVVDVTERARAEEKLTEQKMQTDMAINNMSQGLLMFDSQARLILCNDRYIEMYNLPADAVKPGCTLRELVDHRREVGSFSGDSEQYCRSVLEDVAKGTTWSRTIELSGGRTIHVVNRPLPGGGWVATHEDISERRQAQAQIEYLAHHDPLTDLPNRAAFNDFLAKAIERAADQHGKIAVLCIDLDRFKELNDVFGHAAGDGFLRGLSARLKEAAAGAFLARLGGDEFSLVVTEGPEPAAAEQVAARLLAAADADAGLYRAKADGRGSIRFFEADMDQRLRDRRALLHDLRRPSSTTNWRCTINRSRRSTATSSALRPWRAGTIRLAACCLQPSSFRWLKTAGSSLTSANGCCGRRAARPRPGYARFISRSICQPVNSAMATSQRWSMRCCWKPVLPPAGWNWKSPKAY